MHGGIWTCPLLVTFGHEDEKRGGLGCWLRTGLLGGEAGSLMKGELQGGGKGAGAAGNQDRGVESSREGSGLQPGWMSRGGLGLLKGADRRD